MWFHLDGIGRPGDEVTDDNGEVVGRVESLQVSNGPFSVALMTIRIDDWDRVLQQQEETG